MILKKVSSALAIAFLAAQVILAPREDGGDDVDLINHYLKTGYDVVLLPGEYHFHIGKRFELPPGRKLIGPAPDGVTAWFLLRDDHAPPSP